MSPVMLSVVCAAVSAVAAPSIIPHPVELNEQGGEWELRAKTTILYSGKEATSEPLAIGGFLPLEKVYAFEPVIDGLDAQAASHILGAQGQLWTEYMPNMNHVEYMAFPRACALAELVWLPREQKNYEDFLNRMNVQEKRFDAAGVNYREIKN